MILSKLKEYAENRMDLPPTKYNKRFAGWLISLTEEGRFEGCICLKGRQKEEKNGKEFNAPYRKRAGKTIRPMLLFDTFEYALGIDKPDTTGQRAIKYHTQFKALVQDCADKTGEPTVKAVATFLSSWDSARDRGLLPKDIDSSDVVTFRVGEVIPADAKAKLTKVQEFWAAYLSGSTEEEESTDTIMMQCLITDKVAPVAKRMPISIKGLSAVGGNSTGTELVSANQKPFTSYGLENSLSSPISCDAAELFAKALNSLIADSQSRINIGSTVAYIWWTREETKFNPLIPLSQPKAEEVKALLESPFNAQQALSLNDEKVNKFYALALTANNARAVVRDWLETTVPNVQENLRRWFQHQQLVDPYGADSRPFSVYALAASVYRDASKEMQASAPTALIRCALHGDRLPEDLLLKLIRRNRVDEQKISYPRAVLLKLIFSSDSKRRDMMTNMEQLNPNPNLQGNDLAAYSCGRLLAVLEAIQRSAIGSVNASLTDRYYGSASSTPGVAFPPLLRGARAHFSKLRKTMPGTCKALEERVEEITLRLPTFPKTLNLQQQGLFGLGYYHQRAGDRAAAKAKTEATKATKAEK